jgi:hypothetical protein
MRPAHGNFTRLSQIARKGADRPAGATVATMRAKSRSFDRAFEPEKAIPPSRGQAFS